MSYYRDEDIIIKLKLIISILGLSSFLIVGGVKRINKANSNRNHFDLHKQFNTVIDYIGEGTMIAKIDNYTDFDKDIVGYTTSDGLQVLTGTHNIKLVRAIDLDNVIDLAIELSGGEISKVTCYDMLQNLNLKLEQSIWNKAFSNNYKFNYCIIENEKGVIVKKIKSWKDYNKNNNIQVELEDGTVVLTSFDDLKLINTQYASDDSLYNYALALAGDETRIFGDVKKEDVKVKTRYYHDK